MEIRDRLLEAIGEELQYIPPDEYELQAVADVLGETKIEGYSFSCKVKVRRGMSVNARARQWAKAGVPLNHTIILHLGTVVLCSRAEVIAAMLHEYRHFYPQNMAKGGFAKEYDADRFVARMGFGKELVGVCQHFREDDTRERVTHPRPSERIFSLNRQLEIA